MAAEGGEDPGNEVEANFEKSRLSLVLICRRSTWDIAAGTAWDNCGICEREHLSLTHNLSQAFTTDLPAKLS